MGAIDDTTDAALRALEAGNDRIALETLLRAWADRREPATARVIERLAAEVDAREPGLPSKLEEIGGLGAAAAIEALGELLDAAPDPVIARWLVDLVERARHRPDRGSHLTSHDFWIRLARLLPRHAHVGLRDEIERFRDLHGDLCLEFTAMTRTDVRYAMTTAIDGRPALRARVPRGVPRVLTEQGARRATPACTGVGNGRGARAR